MMLESPPDEIIELSPDRWIVLAFSREWPRYVVEWSVRQRSGESDFPVVGGRVEQEPEEGRPTEELWNAARDQAVAEANRALDEATPGQEARGKGFFSRLFRRES
jgi:hypothetical protein